MTLPKVQIAISAVSDRRQNLIHIQWFVVIACSYLLLVRNDRLAQDSLTFALLVAPFASMLIVLHLSESTFAHRSFPQFMAVVDTLLICTAIIENRQGPWDLCLLFFLGLMIAAFVENLFQIIASCVIVGLFALVVIPVFFGGGVSLDPDTLLRIPLLLGLALLFGYLAEQVKREKRKTAEMEQTRGQQLLTKDQFFSNVSHELRTPLTAVYQFVTIVLDGLAGTLTNEQKEYLGIALRNVRQLQAMVGDLLEAARAESGKLAIHPRAVSLNLSVGETLGTFSANARQKGVELSQDLPGALPLLYVDPRRLKQILTNLVDNALKFTPKGGRVWVQGSPFGEDRDFIRVSVIDSGCGISPADAERIFNRLYQVENSLDTNRNGLGLGLHITKELVVRHGGRIWAEGKVGEGAAFHFTLPVFSLKRLLQSLIEEEGQPIGSLSLISLELLHDPNSPVEVAKAIQEMTWLTLNAMELPQRAALFPNIVLSGERGLFYVLQAKDLEASTDLADRIKKEIALGKQFRNAKCQVQTVVSAIEVVWTEGRMDIDMLAAQIEEKISQAISLPNLDGMSVQARGAAGGGNKQAAVA